MIDNSLMLPKWNYSTLAILIAFSRYPSIASCVVPAAGSDFTAILLLFADGALGNVVLYLFALCCPLPLAVDEADSISNGLLAFGSGSIGLSLTSRAADAAGSDSEFALQCCHLFFPLFSSLYLLSRCFIDHPISSIQSFCCL